MPKKAGMEAWKKKRRQEHLEQKNKMYLYDKYKKEKETKYPT